MFSIKKIITYLCITLLFHASLSAERQSIALFAHGLGGTAEQGQAYKTLIGENLSIIGVNGPEWDQNLYGNDIGPHQSCLGQKKDIKAFVKDLKKNYKNTSMLIGISKGGAVVNNSIGWLAKNKQLHYLKNVKCILLDSTFAAPENVAYQIAHQAGATISESIGDSFESTARIASPILKKIEQWQFPTYNPKGITPIKSIKNNWKHIPQKIRKKLVITLVHSKQDKLISVNDSRKIYIALKELGFKNVYLIETERGQHANTCWGPDNTVIFKNLCLIYRKHNLPYPHIPPLRPEDIKKELSPAEERKKLRELQPSIEVVQKRMSSSWIKKMVSTLTFGLL